MTRTPLFTLRDGLFVPAVVRRDPEAEAVLELYGSGFRHAAGGLTATIGNQPAEILYAGPQGTFAGLDQINLKLPAAGLLPGELPVRIAIGAQASNALTIRLE